MLSVFKVILELYEDVMLRVDVLSCDVCVIFGEIVEELFEPFQLDFAFVEIFGGQIVVFRAGLDGALEELLDGFLLFV